MSIKLTNFKDALRYRGKNVSGNYIDIDGADHGPKGGCPSCIFKGHVFEKKKVGCYLLVEMGMTQSEIFETQLSINRFYECKWFCDYDARTIEEDGVRKEIIRIAKKRGIWDAYERVEIPTKINVKNEGCFIATAVYGDYDHPKVKILRNFRDSKLQPHGLGKIFISLYYMTSPYVLKILRRNNFLKGRTLAIIDRIVLFIEN